MRVQAVILAAGKSTRFNTGKTKLVEPLCGRPMVLYPIEVLDSLNVPITVITGYQKEVVEKCIAHLFPAVQFVEQHEPLGTGHAVLCTRDTWRADIILILNGDIPLITKEIIQDLVRTHIETNASVSFVTSHYEQSATNGYGRVVKTSDGIEIVEARHYRGEFSESCCINAGVYAVNRTFLESYIPHLACNKDSHEFYLTDLIKTASADGHIVSTTVVPFDAVRGVNTMHELWAAEQIKRAELISKWMEHGVRFVMPQSVHIDYTVTIAVGSCIGAGVQLLGTTVIGKHVTIEPYCILKNGIIDDNVTVHSHSVITDSHIGLDAHVGPFAHIRNQSVIQQRSVIGNFVEIKKSSIGTETKIKHLSYVGDAHIGNNVNIGAGTVICNYDGVKKYETVIENNVFIGSNNTLIAPLTVHHNALTAAGSTITKDVPPYTLAFGRSRQVNKEGYYQMRDIAGIPDKSEIAVSNTLENTGQLFIAAVKTDIDTSNWHSD